VNPALLAAWRAELEAGGCCTPAMATSFDRLAAGAPVVVAGQQSGLFLGPLYTLYKALTAVALAERWSAERGTPVVPVFWIASEDHDWDESARLRFPPRGDERWRELRVAGGGGGRSLETIAVPADEVARLCAACRDLAGTGPGAATVAALLARCAPTPWLCERFFGRHAALLLAGLLGDRGLLPLEARLARPHAAAICERERDDPAGGAAALAAGAATMADPPLRPEGPLVFAIGPDGVRRRAAPGDRGTLSPDVALRPVVQDAVLPVVAQVCGPGELRYLEQLGPLYARHGVAVPRRIRRFSAVLVPPKVAEACQRLGVPVDTVLDPEAEAPGGPGLAAGAADAIRALESGLEVGTNRLNEALTEPSDTARKGVERFTRVTTEALGRLRAALEREAAARAGAGEQRWMRVRDALLPAGKPQERTFGLWSYLANHGGAWIETLRAGAGEPADRPRVVALPA
jgi:uncharacterized protein YllA (UPF0747 family)